MSKIAQVLDIAPLRSLVAVSDFGGFQRAATSLHLSQAAVSQHAPHLSALLDEVLPDRRFRIRIDRGTQLREGLAAGSVDLALLLNAREHPRAKKVGHRASVAIEISQLAVAALRQLLSDQAERLRMTGLEAGLELARGA